MRKALEATQVVALRDGSTVKELSDLLALPRSTAHRLVAALAKVGLLEKAADRNGRYVVGSMLGELADGPVARRALRGHCRPEMDVLREATGETVGLHILYAGHRVLIDQSESTQQHRWVYSNPLAPMPLHAGAAAKMLLALLGEAEARQLLGRERATIFTPHTPRSADLLLKQLRGIRARRYAISFEEVTAGISSIAVPVLAEPLGRFPIAVMSLTGPSIRLSERVLKGFLPRLQAAAARSARGVEGALRHPSRAA